MYFRQFILSLSALALCLIAILGQGVQSSPDYDLINVSIATICCFALFGYQDQPYSLYKVFHIFVLFFLCIAPAIQFSQHVSMLGRSFPERLYLEAGLFVLLDLAIFNAVYLVIYQRITPPRKPSNNSRYTPRSGGDIIAVGTWKELFLITSSLIITYYTFRINGSNIYNLLIRGAAEAFDSNLSKSNSLIWGKFFRPMPMFFFLFAYIKGTKHKITLLILALCLLISNCPTGVARNYAAAIWLPVAMTFVPFLRRRNVFVFLMIFALLALFPFLNYFRSASVNDVVFSLNFDQFKDLNFDSFSMFMRVLDSGYITWGRQLLGCIFFFIPRAIWPSKPVGSGHYIAHKTGMSFDNVSMPYIGEGWLNFGAIGMIAFIVILAWGCAYIDKRYWSSIHEGQTSFTAVAYNIALGILFFILRGDLMSSFAYLMGILFSFYTCKKILASGSN